jgi:hypothetical protein
MESTSGGARWDRFEWLVSRWMPEIKHGEHVMHEVENVAWDCTITETRRGSWIGFLIGILRWGSASELAQ